MIVHTHLYEINIHCNDGGKIIHEELESKIDFEDTLIRVHAINEEGYTFLTGVNEEFISYINKYILKTNEEILLRLKMEIEKENMMFTNEIIKITEKILNDEYSDLTNEIDYFRFTVIEDTAKSIEFIPNNLLCILADEIIRLTAIKQKISSEEEYVSIKSHISLMTKSHGLNGLNSMRKSFKYNKEQFNDRR